MIVDRLARTITNYPWLCLIISLTLGLSMGFYAPFTKMENDVDYFRLEGHPDTLYYDYFQQVFGKDEFFVIALGPKAFFTTEHLLLIKKLTDNLERAEGIRRVLSLANAVDITAQDDAVFVKPILDEIPKTSQDLEALRARATGHPLYQGQLISRDGSVASIIIFPQIPENGEFDRGALLEKVVTVLRHEGLERNQYHFAGWTVVNHALSSYMNQDLLRFVPITFLSVTVILFFFLRSLKLTLIGICHILFCIVSTMGFFTILNISLNNVTSIVPPLIIALSLSDSIHILSYLTHSHMENDNDIRIKTLTALKDLIVPCFLTTFTTFVGFLSLATSRMPPIRDFAYTASAGITFEFVYFLILVPSLLIITNPRLASATTPARHKLSIFHGHYLSITLHHSSRLVVVVFAVVTALSFSAMPFIRVNTNILENFQPSDSLRRSLEFVETNLCGTNTIDIVFTTTGSGEMLKPEYLMVIDAFADQARSLEGIDHVISLADLLKHTHQVLNHDNPIFFRIPESSETIAQYLLLYNPDDIDDFVTEKGDALRVTLFTHEHDSEKQTLLLQRIQSILGSLIEPPIQYRITGRVLDQINNINELVQGQLTSLALACSIIWGTILIYFRSWKYFLLSIPPNIFPIALNFALMAIFQISLNSATALIAVVGIGIAVDGTLHFLSTLRSEVSSGLPPAEACLRAVQNKWRPLSTTSVILCVAFSVLLFSHFVPTNQFGMLSSIIMLSALAGDLVFLPALFLFATNRRSVLGGTSHDRRKKREKSV